MLSHIFRSSAVIAVPLESVAMATLIHELRIITKILGVDVRAAGAPVVAVLIGDLIPRQLETGCRLLASHRAVHHHLFHVAVLKLSFAGTVLVGEHWIIATILLLWRNNNIAVALSPFDRGGIKWNIAKHNGALVRAMGLYF